MRRLLIVGTVPYNSQSTSRAFDSYFHAWNENDIAQIFSDPRPPVKGHCGTLFQITDRMMLNRWMHKTSETGKVFLKSELASSWSGTDNSNSSSSVGKLKKFGARHKGAFSHIIRGILWRQKYWCTPLLNKWLDDFHPECVFLSFSDDYFIPQIALYVAKKYRIPIISSIGDDYYFNYRFSLSPLYHIYKLTYRSLIRDVFCHNGSSIYIGNKIRDKYNSEFGLDGKTVYLTSSIRRRAFREINSAKPNIGYFGNIQLGRNTSLAEIANALAQIDTSYKLNVYSNEVDEDTVAVLKRNGNVVFHGSIPYSQVMKETLDCDILVVVEGFEKKDVDVTRYSLSTKVADSLSSGVAVLGYGSAECGAIEYLDSTGCAFVCTERDKLKETLLELLNNKGRQRENYDRAIEVVENNHRLQSSNAIFEALVEREVLKNNEQLG